VGMRSVEIEFETVGGCTQRGSHTNRCFWPEFSLFQQLPTVIVIGVISELSQTLHDISSCVWVGFKQPVNPLSSTGLNFIYGYLRSQYF